MRSRRWKWVGLGAVAAIAAGSAIAVERRRRRWQDYDAAEIRTRLQARFATVEPADGDGPARDIYPDCSV